MTRSGLRNGAGQSTGGASVVGTKPADPAEEKKHKFEVPAGVDLYGTQYAANGMSGG